MVLILKMKKMDRRKELHDEMREAFRDTIRFIKKHNINKIEDESIEIQEEFKQLQKIVCKKEQLCMDEGRRLGKTRIIRLK